MYTHMMSLPKAPLPPRFEASPDCTSIALEVVSIEEGGDAENVCDGAERFTLQLRETASFSVWQPVAASILAHKVSRSIVARPLDPLTVYRFRSVAENAAGQSAGSVETGPLMVGSFIDALREPPTVVATSSAAFSVSWVAARSACQPGVTWDLLYSRVTEADAFHLGASSAS